MTVIVALLFESNLDSFLAYIATIFCTAVGFMFPAAFHLKILAKSTSNKIIDVAIMIFGIVAIFGCTLVNLLNDIK